MVNGKLHREILTIFIKGFEKKDSWDDEQGLIMGGRSAKDNLNDVLEIRRGLKLSMPRIRCHFPRMSME